MKCLIVDDSEFSLELAQELVRDYGVETEGALSGPEAIEKIKSCPGEYVLILMDYRMPEMNGAETTVAIRNLCSTWMELGELTQPPYILGMSGDADEATNEVLMGSGMDGVMGKPLNPPELELWLTKAGLLTSHEAACGTNEAPGDRTESEGDFSESSLSEGSLSEAMRDTDFDYDTAILYTGKEQFFIRSLENFILLSKEKMDKIRNLCDRGDIKNYTVEVHALKSNARSLGCGRLSDMALEHEEAGDRGDERYILSNRDKLLALYEKCAGAAEKIVSRVRDINKKASDNGGKRPVSDEELRDMLEALAEILEAFDIDSADRIVADMKQMELPESIETDFDDLQRRLADVDFAGAIKIVNTIKTKL